MDPLHYFTAISTGVAIGLLILWTVHRVVSKYSIQPVVDDQQIDRDARDYARIQADTRLQHALQDQDMDTLRIMARKGMEEHYREVYSRHALKGEILKPVKITFKPEGEAGMRKSDPTGLRATS